MKPKMFMSQLILDPTAKKLYKDYEDYKKVAKQEVLKNLKREIEFEGFETVGKPVVLFFEEIDIGLEPFELVDAYRATVEVKRLKEEL